MGGEDRARDPARSLAAAAFASAGGGSPCGALWSVALLVAMLVTNLMALYSLSISRDVQRNLESSAADAAILRELASIRDELRSRSQQIRQNPSQEHGGQERPKDDFAKELVEFTAERKLPLGRNPNYGLETMISPIGHQCYFHKELLDRFMSYTPGEICPDDWWIGQSLMLRGCEPLPRRRCFARTPAALAPPRALPDSLWAIPRDDSVLWGHYQCKSFNCLKNRAKNRSVFYDCADCFDLDGPERSRWVNPRDRHDVVGLDEILELHKGTIRIGLDLGGGSGSFAARMRERGVTIVTTTLNLNGPFNEFVAARGLLPIFATIAQRLPFFDNTLDLVHTMHVLSHWLPLESLEFVLFDIDRVLRPGGFLWLDHFFCREEQLKSIYVPLIEKLEFRKIKWAIGKKLDRSGIANREIYLSALLEKPVRRE